MNHTSMWSDLGTLAVTWAPRILLTLAIVLGGSLSFGLLARLMRWLSKSFGLDAAAEKAGVANLLYRLNMRGGFGDLLSRLTWLVGILVITSALAEFAGLPGFATALATVMSYLPRLMIAAGILLLGNWLSVTVRNLVAERRSDGTTADDSSAIGAKLAYWAILTLAATIAAEQAGLETELIGRLIQILVAVIALSAGLTFSQGARVAIRELVARHYYGRLLRPGDHVRIGTIEGRILAFSPTAVIVDDGQLHHIIPCSQLMSSTVALDPADEQLSRPPPEA